MDVVARSGWRVGARRLRRGAPVRWRACRHRGTGAWPGWTSPVVSCSTTLVPEAGCSTAMAGCTGSCPSAPNFRPARPIRWLPRRPYATRSRVPAGPASSSAAKASSGASARPRASPTHPGQDGTSPGRSLRPSDASRPVLCPAPKPHLGGAASHQVRRDRTIVDIEAWGERGRCNPIHRHEENAMIKLRTAGITTALALTTGGAVLVLQAAAATGGQRAWRGRRLRRPERKVRSAERASRVERPPQRGRGRPRPAAGGWPGFHGFHIHSVGRLRSAVHDGGRPIWVRTRRTATHRHRNQPGDLPLLLVDSNGHAEAEFDTDRFSWQTCSTPTAPPSSSMPCPTTTPTSRRRTRRRAGGAL